MHFQLSIILVEKLEKFLGIKIKDITSYYIVILERIVGNMLDNKNKILPEQNIANNTQHLCNPSFFSSYFVKR